MGIERPPVVRGRRLNPGDCRFAVVFRIFSGVGLYRHYAITWSYKFPRGGAAIRAGVSPSASKLTRQANTATSQAEFSVTGE